MRIVLIVGFKAFLVSVAGRHYAACFLLPRHRRFVNLGDRIFMIQKIERCPAETLKLLLTPTTKPRTWRSFLGRHYQVLRTMPVLSVLAHAVHFLPSRVRRCEQIKCIAHAAVNECLSFIRICALFFSVGRVSF